MKVMSKKSRRGDSNSRSSAYEADALPLGHDGFDGGNRNIFSLKTKHSCINILQNIHATIFLYKFASFFSLLKSSDLSTWEIPESNYFAALLPSLPRS